MPERLVDMLELETALYRDLLICLQEEKKLLLRRSREELYELASRMEALVYKIKDMETLRDKVAKDAALKLGLLGEGGMASGLSAIISKVNGPLKGALEEKRSVLASIIASIGEITRENSIIIGRSLDNINNAFMFLKGLTSPQTYTSTIQGPARASKGT